MIKLSFITIAFWMVFFTGAFGAEVIQVDHMQQGDVFGVSGYCREADVEAMKWALRGHGMKEWIKFVLRKDNSCIDARVIRVPPLYPVTFIREHSRECIKGNDIEFMVFKDRRSQEAITWEIRGSCTEA